MQGYLKKKGGWANMEWQVRYFRPSASNPQVMDYFLSDTHVNPNGSFSMNKAVITTSKKGGKNIIEIQAFRARKYVLLAGSDEDHAAWVTAFRKMIEGDVHDPEEIERNLDTPTEMNRKGLADAFLEPKKELAFERFSASAPQPGSPPQSPTPQRKLNKRVIISVQEEDFSSIIVDDSKFNDPAFKKALKLRPTIKIENEEILKSLSNRFRELEPSCIDSRCIPLFPRTFPQIDNVSYDKSLHGKSDLLRRLSQSFAKTVPVPVRVELNEESLFAKIREKEGSSKDEKEGDSHEHRKNRAESAIIMEPANIGGISLEKKDESSSQGISLEKKNEEEEKDFVDLPLSDQSAAKLSGISLEKKRESIELPPVEEFSLEPALPVSGISLTKKDSSLSASHDDVSLTRELQGVQTTPTISLETPNTGEDELIASKEAEEERNITTAEKLVNEENRVIKEEVECVAKEVEEKRLEEECLAKEEADRIEADRLEAERLAKEEAECLETERLAKEAEEKRLEEEHFAREEAECLAREEEKQLEERLAKEEADRIEAERLAKEAEEKRLEEERLAKEAEEKRLEEERLARIATEEAERLAKEAEGKRLEEERLAREEAKRLETERLAEEKRVEEERLAKEEERLKEAEEKRLEEESLAREEAKRLEAERLAKEAEEKRLEAERLVKEAEEKRVEEERLAREAAERLEAERLEAERLAKEAEKKRLEEEHFAREADRLAKEEEEKRLEEERLAKEEADRIEAERLAKEAEEKRLEEERLAKEETERLAREAAERIAKEAERLEAERLEAERLAKEAEEKRLEEERLAKEEAERLETERLAKEAEEKRLEEERIAKAAEEKRLEEARLAKEEAERLEAERLAEEKRIKEERLAREEAERIEADRIAKEAEEKRIEEERLAREEAERKAKAETERLAREEADRIEAERLVKEEEEKRLEAERLAKEEANRIEAERLAKEAERLARETAERLAKEEEEKRLEEERLAKEEANRIEAERLAKEAEEKRLEEERLAKEETERLARETAERIAKEAEEKRLEEERLAKEEADRIEAERLAKEAEEKRLEEERLAKEAEERLAKEAEEKRLEEERLAEEKRLEEERLAKEEAERLEVERLAKEAEEKRLEEERIAKEAEEKRLEEARIVREEAERLEAERLAEEKRIEEERLAREEAERIVEEKRLEEERIAREVALQKEKEEKERLQAEERSRELAIEAENAENDKQVKEARSFIDRKLKDAESNLDRFFDRSENYYAEALATLENIRANSSPAVIAFINETKPSLDEWGNRITVLKACKARRADGSCLEYGLDYHLKNFVGALEKGIPGDPRFPDRDNKWIADRAEENDLLVQWLTVFKSQFKGNSAAEDTITRCEAALTLYTSVVEAAKIPLAIQNARNARRADGSCLEYGLDHHLKNMNGALEKGVPGDPRFPERDNEWIAARGKENELLAEWLEVFKSNLGEHEESQETIQQCESSLELYKKVVDAARVPLMIQNARNARRADGSCLEYGLEYHLKNFNGALEKGVPGDPRFPERDNEYIADMKKRKELLVEWLEDFKSKLGDYEEAHHTIHECKETLQKYKKVVGAAKVPLMIQNARNARTEQGSCLEYGLKHHLDRFNSALNDGIPGDSRRPEKDNEYIDDMNKRKELLVEWLEDFKSKHAEYEEAQPTIQECESALELCKKVVDGGRIPLMVQNARNARTADGSCLEYGLDYHLDHFNAALDKGVPGEPRFPERDNEYIADMKKRKELLVEWLEDFKSRLGDYEEAHHTIHECKETLQKYKKVVGAAKVPLMIQNARNARTEQGSCLEYGLKHHLDRFNSALNDGIPGDSRRPEKDNEYIDDMNKRKELLVEWLEDFKSKHAEYEEAQPTIQECESALELCKKVVDGGRVKLLIQNARNARTADGSCLEYGLDYHLDHYNAALEKGIPGDPRFPDRDNEYIDDMNKRKELLVEWLEDFKSKHVEYEEAQQTIQQCESALELHKKVVDGARVQLMIQNARNARSADGSCLEYGLEYHLKQLAGALEKGIPGDPRFPERDNEYIVEQGKRKELLVEWLEDFKSKCGEYEESKETIQECESALELYKKVVDGGRVKLLIQNARNARRNDGSCLEYGLEYHLKNFVGPLEKGIPGDPRFPDRDNKWIDDRGKEKELLVEWLEGFKSKLGEYEESRETIEECESALELYKKVVDAVKIPLMIKNARNARRADGSCLEYGLEYHLKNFIGPLEKGIPGDPRFPDRDNKWIDDRGKEKELLLEWLEDFKSKCGEYEESQETIKECESALELYKKVVDAVKIPLMVKNARNARRADGSCLEYGLEYHLKNFIGPLEKGIPGDPRRPEKDNEWIAERVKEKELLVEWLEDFKSKLGEYEESRETIEECESALELYQSAVESVRIPLMIQNARNARRADGSCLEYGLEYHLKNFIGPLEKGIPGDPRFPERDNEWINERVKQKELLVQWLEDFKSKCGEHDESHKTIEECESALELYKKVVDAVKIPLMVKNARNARRKEGSCLEYGLEYHLKNMNAALDKGIPGDPRFPERDNEWLTEEGKQKELLVEWLEDFKSKLGEYKESRETIEECESVLEKYTSVVDAVRIPMMIKNARNARRADGSCLEYGLEYHLKNMNAALEKGIPGDPRFPDRDNKWIEERVKEKELLVEWLEDFKSKCSEHQEAQPSIQECESALEVYQKVVESIRVPLMIQNARNARRADGSCLEYGLEYHLKNMNAALEKGIPGDPRFPERDNEWIDSRVKEKELLVEWLEDFKSKCAEYEESRETIEECEESLFKYKSVVDAVRIPLMIQNARNARRKEGSCLEYGLEYHLKNMNAALEKGIPGDARRPEKDNEWLAERVKEKELLVQWLEDFKSKHIEYEESRETIGECESVLEKYTSVVDAVRIPLMVKNARNARRADGSCLEYGLEYHLKNMNAALEKGIPGDPRFPDRDNEWIEERVKEKELLVEWLEDFKSKCDRYEEAQPSIQECESALEVYQKVVESVRIPLMIQNSRNARRADGSCLEYGLEYHLKNMNAALEKGIPGDPRFPERDNEWIDSRVKEKELLVEWLEDFKSKCAEYEESRETIEECEESLFKYKSVVDAVRIPLMIQNARNARRADGSCLEYGLEYHLKNMNAALEKGIPGDPRFPERDNEWLAERVKEKELLVQWLEDFKSKHIEYEESRETIEECESVLEKYTSVVDAVRIPLMIQNARNARRADGSCLEYGLEYHLKNMNAALEKGIPGDARRPEKDNEWIEERVKEKELLVEWLEDFKSKCDRYEEAQPSIQECESALEKYIKVVESVRIPLMIQNSRNARRADGSCLEYGLEYHLKNMNAALEKGIPGDPRFPERDNEWIDSRVKEKELLVEWLEDFKSKCAEYEESRETIEECEESLFKYKSVVDAVRIPLMIQNARNARRKEGSCLEYGLEYHLKNMNAALEKGLPGDPRFPERDNEWIAERVKEKELLVQWLEDFKSKHGEYTEAQTTIEESEKTLEEYQKIVEKVRIPLLIQNARNARKKDGSCLEYGLSYHLEHLNGAIEKGLPGDPRFPERDNEWIAERVKQKELLVEWLEDFKSKCGEYTEESRETIRECETTLDRYKQVVDAVRIPLMIQNARNARRADGSCLEYGLEYHLKNFNAALEKGLPGDPRFPDRDNEWITERVKEKELLVEWLEDFKSKCGEHTESLSTISDCEKSLDNYHLVVESVRIPLMIKNARNARKAEGSCLEYGLEYHLKNLNAALEKGLPGDPRFPERDNEWIAERVKEKELLVEWLEDFKSKCAEHDESRETIIECEETLNRYQSAVESVRIPLMIQNARNARRTDGSCLEYGLEYHLKNMNAALEKGIPGDPRFPDRDNKWIEERVKEKELLVEWLEDFKSKHSEYLEALSTVHECESALDRYSNVVESVRIPLMIQNARNARRTDGSCLEYGLEYHLKNMNAALENGLPGDPRFPERDNEWIALRVKEKELLVEWLEDFKSKCAEYEESQPTIQESESALNKYREVVESVRIPLVIQNARNARRKEGSCLEYGLEFHLNGLRSALEKGIPGNPRFPERDNEWIAERTKERELLVEWLEDFKSKFSELREAQSTIEECESLLDTYRNTVDPIRIPLMIQNARNARRAQGSCLEYGLDYHLKNFQGTISKGLPADPRFPEKDNLWIIEQTKNNELLIEWLESFKSEFSEYEESWETIRECELLSQQFHEIVDKVKIPLDIQNARNAKRAQGSVLEYGVDYHLKNFRKALEDGLPGDTRFPERDNEWMEARSKERDLLIEWLEDFKAKFMQYDLAKPLIDDCESALQQYRTTIDPIRVPLLIQSARNARRAQGSCLEFGMDYHLKNLLSALEKGLPGDPRFPERDNEWIAERVKEKELLVEWLEDFKSSYGQYNESSKTITECENALQRYTEVVEKIKLPLDIQNARNARRNDGSPLEYGLDYHLKNFNSLLNSGFPDSTQPKNELWLQQCTQHRDLLVEWLEDFKSKFQEFTEAHETISNAESFLSRYSSQVNKIKVPLDIQKARNARRTDGSVLEFGLEYHLSQMTSSLDKGLPGDKRFPERDNEWLEQNLQMKEKLVEWLEDFRSRFEYFTEAQPTIIECEEILSKADSILKTVKIPLLIQNARSSRTILPYGLEFHLKNFSSSLRAGLPNNPRFPDRNVKWMEERYQEKDLLVNWLEDFRANFSEYGEAAQPTIKECEEILSEYETIVGKLLIPLQIQQEIQRRDSSSGCTLDTQIIQFENAVGKGLPGDPRFPERDNDFMNQRKKEFSVLIDRLEDFKSKFIEYQESQEIIKEGENAIAKYKKFVSDVQVPLRIQNARNARRTDGSVLEYGLDYALNALQKELAQPISSILLDSASVQNQRLIEWLENFKCSFMEHVISEHPLVIGTIAEVEKVLTNYKNTVSAVLVPLAVIKARSDRSILEYGLDYHMKRFKVLLEAPQETFRVDEICKLSAPLINWLEAFKVQFSDSKDLKEVQETIDEVEKTLQIYTKKIGGAKALRDMAAATEARTILPYGLSYQLSLLEKFITKQQGGKEVQAQAGLLMFWLEDFRSRFQFVDGCSDIVTRVENILDQFQQTFPREAAAQFVINQQRKAKKTADRVDEVESGIDDDTNDSNTTRGTSQIIDPGYESEDDEIPSETSSNDVQVSICEPDAPGTRVSILPEFKQVDSIDESSLDRSVPSELTRGSGYVQELEKKQKSLQESLSVGIVITVDWSFVHSGEYKALSDEEQQKAAQNMVFGILSRTVLSDTGFLGVCQSNKLSHSILCSSVEQIELSYSPSSLLSKNVEYSLTDKKLQIQMNLNAWNKSIDTKDTQSQLETLFNIKYLRALSQLQSQSESTGNALQKTLQRKNQILVQISGDFLADSTFQGLSVQERIDCIERLGKVMKTLLITSNGLSDLCEKSATTKRCVFSSVREIHIGYHCDASVKTYSLTFDRNNGILRFHAVLKQKDTKLEDLDVAFDSALGLVALKAVDASKSKLQAYQNIIQRKIKASIIVEVDWSEWMNHQNFLSFSVPKQTKANQAILQKHLNEIINGECGLIECYNNSSSDLQKIFLRKLRKIKISYDPTNSINFKHSKNYPYFELSFDHKHCTLSVRGNLKSFEAENGRGWKDFAEKLIPILETATYRYNFDAKLRRYHHTQIHPVTESKLKISFDWDSFVNRENFLTLPKAKRTGLLQSIENIHYPNILKQVKEVCAHEIGKNSLQEKVQAIVVTTDSTILSGITRSPKCSEGYVYNEDTGELKIFIPYERLLAPGDYQIKSWQIRWALGISIDVAKDIGSKNMEKHRAAASQEIGKEISLDFDWKFLEMDEFLSTGPLPIVKTIEQSSDDLIKRVFMRGLVAICSHPIGRKCIHDNIHQVSVVYSPLCDNSHDDSEVIVDGNILRIQVAANSLHSAISSRYKERIEFEYDLIVAIAKDNAIGTLHEVEKQLETLTGRKTPIHVDLSNFTQLDTFRMKNPSDQADIITNLFAKLPKQIFASTSVGLASFLSYDVAVAPFLSKVSSLEFFVDPTNSLTSDEGEIRIVDGKLEIHLNLTNVLSAVSVGNWKERILFVLDMLVDISRYETREKRQNIENQYRQSMKASECTIDINWNGFIRSDEFISFHPTVQVEIIKSCNTQMLNVSLLGNDAFTGPKGLCEFDSTISFLREQFESLVFDVIPANSSTKGIRVDSSVKQLIISYPLSSAHKDIYEGCHASLEQLLRLRSIKQAAAIARAEKQIASDCADLFTQYCPVVMEWSSFVDTLGLDYVSIIDEVATVPKRILMGKTMRSFGNIGVMGIVASSSSVSRELKKFKSIKVELEPNNNVRVDLGRSHSLNATCFAVRANGDDLVIRSNLKSRMAFCGVGRPVQFALCEGEALAEEQNAINQIAAQMTRDEEQRRSSAIQRAHEKNNDITKQNARDQEDYQKKMQEYHKKQNERCNYSQCNAGYTKCGVCQGRGHNTNNNNTSTCSSCKGQGKRQCNNCKGTQKKYPNGVSMPSVPNPRSMESIPTFGSMPNYRAQI